MTALVGEEGADVESDGEAATEVFLAYLGQDQLHPRPKWHDCISKLKIKENFYVITFKYEHHSKQLDSCLKR